MAEPTQEELTTYTDDEIGVLRFQLEREVARRAAGEKRPVYVVSVMYPSGNMTDYYKDFEAARRAAIEALVAMTPDEKGVCLEAREWSLSEYNARPSVVYG